MSNMTPTLGQIMKKARLEQRFTQEEIAERIGCHPQYYKNLENDKGTPSIPVLKGKLPTAQNKCSVLKFLFLFLDLGVVIHNPWLQIPPLLFFCG